MPAYRFLLVLICLFLAGIGMAQRISTQAYSVRVQLYDSQSFSTISERGGIRLLSPPGGEISTVDTDSLGWFLVDLDSESAVELVAYAEGYRSDTFLLQSSVRAKSVPLAPISNVGGRIDRQPVVRRHRQTSRQAPPEMNALELMVLPEKRGGGIPRLQRLPSMFTGFTIALREDQEVIRKGDPLLQEFGKIMWKKQTDKSYNYYTGTFTSLLQAKTFLDEKVIEYVPKAKIIEFISGHIHAEVQSTSR